MGPSSPHFQEDLSDFGTDLHEGVEVAAGERGTQCIKVVCLEALRLPRTAVCVCVCVCVKCYGQYEQGVFYFLTSVSSRE